VKLAARFRILRQLRHGCAGCVAKHFELDTTMDHQINRIVQNDAGRSAGIQNVALRL
jgi:hypothetical protein